MVEEIGAQLSYFRIECDPEASCGNRMKRRGMSRIGYCLPLVLIVGLATGPLLAQAPASPPVSASSLAPEKMMAKEKAVEEHAQKRAECRKQAKENGLGWLGRRKFVHECMAAK
jgi:hypothetical protein